jgi:hypothetical protein
MRAHRHFENWQTQCKLPLSDTGVAMRGASTLWREVLGYENEIIARLGRSVAASASLTTCIVRKMLEGLTLIST